MSLGSLNKNTIIKDKIHNDAKMDTYYLTGRILTLSKPNPNWVPTMDDKYKDIVEMVPMSISGINGSESLSIINKSPLTIKVLEGWRGFIPTGYKHPKLNQERKIEVLGPVEITHGASIKSKDLSEFLTFK